MFCRLQAKSSKICRRKQKKEEAVLHLPLVLAELFKSKTEDEERFVGDLK